jgi:hypothetical protein
LDCALLSIRAAFWDPTPIYISFLEIYISFLELKADRKMPIREPLAINDTSLHADLTVGCGGYHLFLWLQGTPAQHPDAMRADVLGPSLFDIAWIAQHQKL